jgi:WD40 repeat protein
MAPEQAGSGAAVGPTADLYSLGVILYDLLTGRTPFVADTPIEVLLRARSEEPVPPGRVRLGLPRDLESICLKCLEREPGRRYATASDLAQELCLFLSGQPLRHTRRVTMAERAWRWCRRNRAVAALMATVWVSLLTGAGIAAYFAVEADRRAKDAAYFSGEYAQAADRATENLHDANGRRYVSDIRMVGTAYGDGRLDDAIELLEGLRPDRTAGRDYRGFEWYYWDRLCHHELLSILRGHEGIIVSVAFSPDGRKLVTGGADSTVRVWNLEGELPPVVIGGHGGWVSDVAVSPDGRFVASTGDGLVLRVSRLDDGQTVFEIRHSSDRVMLIGKVSYSPDGRRIAVAYHNLDVQIVDAATGRVERVIPRIAPNMLVPWVSFAGDGRTIAFGDELLVRVYDLERNEAIVTIRPGKKIAKWTVTHDGRTLAVVDIDGTTTLWETRTGRAVATVHETEKSGFRVGDIQFTPDGSALVAAVGRDIRVCEPGSSYVRSYRENMLGIRAVAVSPDGRRLAYGGTDGTVRVRDAVVSPEPHLFPQLSSGAVARLRSDGRLIAAAQNGEARVWDPTTGRLEAFLAPVPLSTSSDSAMALALAPDDRRLAVRTRMGGVHIMSLAGGGRTGLRGFNGACFCAAFSPDGWLLAAGGDHAEFVWDLRASAPPRRFHDPSPTIYSVAFSPDGRSLASSGDIGEVTLRGLDGSSEPRRFRGHTSNVLGMAFDSDGSRLATACSDGTVRVWDVSSGQSTMVLRGHPDLPTRVAFSPDGRRLASGGSSGWVMLWDLAGGQRLLSTPGSGYYVFSLEFAPDGQRLVVSYGPEVGILDARPRTAATLAEAQARGQLDRQRRLAAAHERNRRWADAVAEFDRLVALEPVEPAHRRGRGRALAASRRYEEAADAYDVAFRLDPAIDVTQLDGSVLEHAALLALAGPRDRYVEYCRAVVRSAGRSPAPGVALGLARICALGSPPAVGGEVLLKWAGAVDRTGPASPRQLHTTGLAYLRASRYADALTRFQESDAKRTTSDAAVLNWLGMSLAYRGSGNQDEARAWRDRAVAWMSGAGPDALPTPDRLEADILRHDVEALP